MLAAGRRTITTATASRALGTTIQRQLSGAKEALSEMWRGLVSLYRETQASRPARRALKASADGARSLSWHQLEAIKRNNADLRALLPFLIVLNAPGGLILVPALAKLMPSFLPSTFLTEAQAATVYAAHAKLRSRCASPIAAYFRGAATSDRAVADLVFAAQAGAFASPAKLAAALASLPEASQARLTFDTLPDSLLPLAAQYAGISSLRTRFLSRPRLEAALAAKYAQLELEDVLLADTMMDDSDDIPPLTLHDLRTTCDERAIDASVDDDRASLLKSLTAWLNYTPSLYDAIPELGDAGPVTKGDLKRIHQFLYGTDDLPKPDTPHLVFSFQVLSTINALSRRV
ncbi:uncharacterized protein AMSG_08772 [Thecamonas trahens ATCC 50062]|uniref:Letm1 RBD domain-containing protein n=1 Tax=Thecamonas trahens ATCC 50062 TaxID=461836 RepID=A0A0L0DLT5_THETB|nr:hypothetical protein AMSG_08772 [Thecamonas trahens ATCC 50062]KNC53279.1 hypothetical protein AMSG_08772 [Thecamonas trahens ATCC 50062]|eukprot:XP_013754543.1 hypothetical protein AMSG_08772 [Thecamonas trahens ATCC 50062]